MCRCHVHVGCVHTHPCFPVEIKHWGGRKGATLCLMEKGRKWGEKSKEEDIIRINRQDGRKWKRLTGNKFDVRYEMYRVREGAHRNKGWKRTWQRREADRDNMWQWSREVMSDRFNEVFPDVILNCNYSVLLSAWVCAAPNIPSELVWSRLCPLARSAPSAHDRTWSQDSSPAGDSLLDSKSEQRRKLLIYLSQWKCA